MPIVDNPYLSELQNAMRSDDEVRQAEIYLKWRTWNRNALTKLTSDLETVQQQTFNFKKVYQADSKNKQYKNAIKLYQQCRDLLIDIRKLKKLIRENP